MKVSKSFSKEEKRKETTFPPNFFGSHCIVSLSNLFLGYTLVCLACLMSALGVVLTKKITKQVDKNVIMFYLGVGTIVCGFIGLFGFGKPSNPPAWEWALSLGKQFFS